MIAICFVSLVRMHHGLKVMLAVLCMGGAALGDLTAPYGTYPVDDAQLAWECNGTDQGGAIVQACQPAQASFFNNMAHINSAIRFRFEDHAAMVGHVMVQRHGLDDVGAWRMHHHFKIKPGEYLISQAQRNASGNAKLVVSVKSAVDLEDQKLIPLAFAYSKQDRLWWPVQFYAFAKRDQIGDALALRYHMLNSESGLQALGELGQALVAAGLNEHIGISIQWGDLFGVTPGTVMLETTNETSRSQEFTLDHGRAKHYITTHNFFKQNCEAHFKPIRHGCTMDCAVGYACQAHIVCDTGPHGEHSSTDFHVQYTEHHNVHDDGN